MPNLKHTLAHGSVQTDEDAPQAHSTPKDEDHTMKQGHHTKNNTVAAMVQHHKTPADHLTLQHEPRLDQGRTGSVQAWGRHLYTWNKPSRPKNHDCDAHNSRGYKHKVAQSLISVNQHTDKTDEQPTLQRMWNSNLDTKDLNYYRNEILALGASHQGSRTPLKVHTTLRNPRARSPGQQVEAENQN